MQDSSYLSSYSQVTLLHLQVPTYAHSPAEKMQTKCQVRVTWCANENNNSFLFTVSFFGNKGMPKCHTKSRIKLYQKQNAKTKVSDVTSASGWITSLFICMMNQTLGTNLSPSWQSIWYTDGDATGEVESQPAVAPKKRTMVRLTVTQASDPNLLLLYHSCYISLTWRSENGTFCFDFYSRLLG